MMPSVLCYNSFSVMETVLDRPIIAHVFNTAHGLQILLFGGDLPHIGSVAVISPQGNIDTIEFIGHKEGVLCKAWAEALKKHHLIPAVITSGIHYDQLSKEGVCQVLRTCDILLDKILNQLFLNQKD